MMVMVVVAGSSTFRRMCFECRLALRFCVAGACVPARGRGWRGQALGSSSRRNYTMFYVARPWNARLLAKEFLYSRRAECDTTSTPSRPVRITDGLIDSSIMHELARSVVQCERHPFFLKTQKLKFQVRPNADPKLDDK